MLKRDYIEIMLIKAETLKTIRGKVDFNSS